MVAGCFKIIFYLCLFYSSFTLAQEVKLGEAGLARDGRIFVNHFSLFKRFTSNGRGEYLEVLIDIENKTDEDLNFKFFVLGFHEVNKIDKAKRRYIPYPTWRERDFEAENLSIVYLDSIPKISEEKLKNFVPNLNKYASFLQYINYINKNPDDGIDVFISGLNGLGNKSSLYEGEKYSISNRRLGTSITLKLNTPYGAKARPFNHIGLILVDMASKKVAYRQFYKIKGKIKVR